MSTLLSLALALFAGLMMTRVINRFKLPDVTAYLIAGILVGPYCLGLLGVPGLGFSSFEDVEKLQLISKAALGFIAFSIGSEFRLSQLRQTGKQATIVGIVQGIVAMLFVDVALVVLHFIIPDKLSDPRRHHSGRHRHGDSAGRHADGRSPVQGQGPPDRYSAARGRAG